MSASLKTLAAIALAALLCAGCSPKEGLNALPSSAGTSSATESPSASEESAAPQSISVQLDGISYRIPVEDEKFSRFSFAARTSRGIVWTTAPRPEPYGSSDAPLYYPASPFVLYLDEADEPDLSVQTSKKLLVLPLKDKDDYLILDALIGMGDYVIYHTYSFGRGAAQATVSNVWAFRVTDPAHVYKVSAFHDGGGLFYNYGANAEEGVYVGVSDLPNAEGDYDHEAYAYLPATNRKVRLERYTLENGIIRFELEGKAYSIKLQQG